MTEFKNWTLKNRNGIEISVLEIGGAIQKWIVPVNYQKRDIVLGYDKSEQYLENKPSFGVIIGRYANRIKNGEFVINDRKYSLARNNEENHLHGGEVGLGRRNWTGLQFGDSHLRLTYFSPDGEEGYPGNVDIRVDYRLSDENELKIKYWARSDQDTILNLTQHSYFNLDGHDKGSILDHKLVINSNQITENDDQMIPTGKFLAFENQEEGESLNKLIKRLGGVDHNFILGENGKSKSACKLFSTEHDLSLEVETTEPGLQVFTANFGDESYPGKEGVSYGQHSAVALETQHYPDSPNQPGFPSTLLREGKEYHSETIFRLSFPE